MSFFKKIGTVLVIFGLTATGVATVQASPGEPRYCMALIDALSAKPDSSLFPMNTAKKRRLAEVAWRKQEQLFTKTRLIAKSDGDITVANGLYWRGRNWVGNQSAYRALLAGNAQAERDCGLGYLFN